MAVTIIVEFLTIIFKILTIGWGTVIFCFLFIARGCLFFITGIQFAKSQYKTKFGHSLFFISCLLSLLYSALWLDSSDAGIKGGIINIGDPTLQSNLSFIFFITSIIASIILLVHTKKQKNIHESPNTPPIKNQNLILSCTICSLIIIIFVNFIYLLVPFKTGLGLFMILIHPVIFTISGVHFSKLPNKTAIGYVLYIAMCATGLSYVAFFPAIEYSTEYYILETSPYMIVASYIFLGSVITSMLLLAYVEIQKAKSQ